MWLHNVHIPEYNQGTWNNHAPRRKRKLLLHRAEIHKLIGKTKETGLTLIPLELYFKDGKAKVEIGLARGKKTYDKRQTLMERQNKREAERAMAAAFKRNNTPLPPDQHRTIRAAHTDAQFAHGEPAGVCPPEPLPLDHGPGKPKPKV